MINIAVIDNTASHCDLLDSMLVDFGWQLFSFTDHQIDLEQLEMIDPTLIILDFGDQFKFEGCALLQQIKMTDSLAKLPILVYSTLTHVTADVQRYLVAQHIPLVQKPFAIESFVKAIRDVLQRDIAMEVLPQLPILIIEDNEALREEIETVLRLDSYPVVTAANGALGLDALREQSYGLIILDVTMPVMTGLEFLEVYYTWPVNHVPVLVTSGDEDLADMNLPAFVVGILTKPFHINHLNALVRQYSLPITA